jgi:hypothetical protein
MLDGHNGWVLLGPLPDFKLPFGFKYTMVDIVYHKSPEIFKGTAHFIFLVEFKIVLCITSNASSLEVEGISKLAVLIHIVSECLQMCSLKFGQVQGIIALS